MSAPFKSKLHGHFITQDGLDNIAQYKYSGEDQSVIYKYLVDPLAKFLCGLLPLSVSANVLTLFGLLFSMAAYVLMARYVPWLIEDAPRWVYFVTALFILLYLMLDAMDGTQARRNNMASPIGELFDHLCDSCSLTLCVLVFASMARMGPQLAFATVVIFFIPFYCSHWDDYNTGKLKMGKFGGPTDLLVGLIAVLVITGCAGSHIWITVCFRVYSFVARVHHVVVALLAFGALISASQYVSHCVDKFRRVPEVNRNWGKLFFQFFAFFYFLTVSILWVTLDPRALDHYPHRFPLAIGFINAYLLARLIVQRVTKEAVQAFHTIFTVYTLGFLVTVVDAHYHKPHSVNFWVVHVLLFCGFANWLFFFFFVVRQLSRHLKLPVFSVLPERAQQKATENTALLSHNQDQRQTEEGDSANEAGSSQV